MDFNRIPLIVGVTGHRNLREEDHGPLREAAGRILQKLHRHAPHTPLLVLSSLAEGADRLVAEAALEQGFAVFAPLPMPRAEYEKDFAGQPGSREAFARLLDRTAGSFAVPFVAGVTAETVGKPELRAEQYAAAGKFIVHHCHVLLALWDGEHGEKKGGTSQMVRYRLSGFPRTDLPEWASLYPPDSGPVYHLVTPRVNQPPPADAFAVHEYYTNFLFSRHEEDEESEPEAKKIFFSLLRRTDGFNRDLKRFSRREPEFRRAAALLAPEAAASDAAAERLLGRYGAADVLATHFRGRRHLSLGLLAVLIVPTSLFLADYDNPLLPHELRWICLSGFSVSVLFSLAIFLRARWDRFETKHLDYRALAEGLKILYFWRLAGLQDDVSAQYLRKQRSEMDWIRLAIRACDLPAFAPPARDPFAWIESAWIEDQRSYFGETAARSDRLRLRSKIYVTIILLLATTLTVTMLIHPPSHAFFYESTGLLVALLATAGAVLAYIEKLGLPYESKQYRQMQRLFSSAAREYRLCLEQGQARELRAIIRRLGHEALRENGDWLLLHRDRPMEIHVA